MHHLLVSNPANSFFHYEKVQEMADAMKIMIALTRKFLSAFLATFFWVDYRVPVYSKHKNFSRP